MRPQINVQPSLLFYCQHSLGMGHLVRSLALAAGLSKRFRVVLLNGGPLPKAVMTPRDVEIVTLPPLGLGPNGQLVSRDHRRTVERAQNLRRRIILETFRTSHPQVVLIELFPFGRKKFADELLPLLEEARNVLPSPPLVVCSLRDILVGRQENQRKHDERAVALANHYFDAILVHSDPAFARLEESFRPVTPLHIPVYHTGFAFTDRELDQGTLPTRPRQIIVSAGGGLVGEPLLRTAVEAYPLLSQNGSVKMKIVAGPFLPDEAWNSLRAGSHGQKGLVLRRFVPDLPAEMRASAASVSQCGYNTALDILRAGVPALVVPFAANAEDEQTNRARRLERLGALRVLEPQQMNAHRLAHEIRALLCFKPSTIRLDLNGAQNTARIVRALAYGQAPAPELQERRAAHERVA